MIEVNEISVVVDVFFRDPHFNVINKFMHSVDVYEPGKQFADYMKIPFISEDITKLQNLVNQTKKAIEATKGTVLFIGVREIGGVKPKDSITYFTPGIQTLSMLVEGDLKWGLFKDILQQLGYKVKVSENMHVIEVS